MSKVQALKPFKLVVSFSNKFVYACVIDTPKGNGVLLAAASSMEKTLRESLRGRGLPTSDVNAASEVSQLLASKLLALHERGMTDLSSRELVFYKPKGKRYHGKLRALVEGLKDAGVKVKHAKRGKLM